MQPTRSRPEAAHTLALPADHALRFVVAEDPEQLPLMVLRPPGRPALARLPVAVCVHGDSRQPLAQLKAFAPLAAEQGFALVLPLFDERHHRCYQQLLHPRRGTRSDLLLLHVLEGAALRHGLDVDRLYLFGYSGGAQFVHRFAMRHPGRTAALAIGAAGWYTWPDPQAAWPLGTSDADGRMGGAMDLCAFLRLPMALWVGERDNQLDEQVREHPALLQQQGAHRLERAQRWAAEVRERAARKGIRQPLPLTTLPRAGHDFSACHRRGDLAGQVMAFFARERQRPRSADWADRRHGAEAVAPLSGAASGRARVDLAAVAAEVGSPAA